MARGVLCPKCATVNPATVTACSKCHTSLIASEELGTFLSTKKPKDRGTNHGLQVTMADEEAPTKGTQPSRAHAPDATVAEDDHDATMDADHHDQLMRDRLGLGSVPAKQEAPTQPAKPPGRRVITSPGAARALGPVPSTNVPAARRSLANHQAAVAAAAAAPAPPRKDPLTGEKLGEYIVEQKIGTGGMGVVYKARQPQIGSTVAIKILRSDVIADKRDMERLLDEARVVNAIKHRGIINIFGAGELSDGRQYLVMEYLDGETLEKRLEKVGQLSTLEAIPILDEVLAALAAAHATGIVHRDLKPANIFLVKQSDGPDLVKLLDFGLARRQMQEVSRIAGTPDYISPEHARGRPAGPPADLYGFGILAFHLLTGQLPFRGNSPMEMMEKHVHEKPPVPAEVNPTIPPAMSGLILALLEKDPSKRPDADAAKRDLKAAGRQLQLMDVPDGATPRDGRPAMTALGTAELDPRLKELARKGDLTKLLRSAARNWPWVLASLGLLFIVAVVIWMLVTPTVPRPAPTAIPIPAPKKPPPTPVKVAPPVKAEPAPVEAVEAAPKPEEPVAPVVAAPAEKHDPGKAAARAAETAINKWRLKLKNDLALLDARLSGELEHFRPALNALAADIENVNNAQGQASAEARFATLKDKIEAASE